MRSTTAVTIAASAIILAGCSDAGPGTGTSADATVRFNVATSSATALPRAWR